MKAYVIGAGGVGSWIAPSLIKLIGATNVILVDGDTLEERNLDRQLFTRDQLGRNKAEALAELYGCECIAGWYSSTTTEHHRSDVLLGVVDNHPARASILSACDHYGCMAILAANEVHSAEAYVYRKEWQNTNLDPRVYYPDIVKVTDGDPRAQAAGCTGEAQQQNRQLVSSNFNAAALAQHLFVNWVMEAPKLEPEARKHLPHLIRINLTSTQCQKAGEPKLVERTNHE